MTLKPFLLFLLMITGVNLAQAQEEQKHSFYVSGELGFGNYYGLDFSYNYLYKEKYSFKLGYIGNIRKAETLPHDYTSGLFNALLLGFGTPVDQLKHFQLGAGRIYNLNKKATIRVNLSVGLGYSTIKEPGNWQSTGSHLLQENYTWEYDKYRTLSLIINPKIEFPLSRFYGLTLSPMVQLNKDRTYVGIGVGHMIGLLRSKRVPDPAEL
ncbi:hypothetical protein [Salinimicrobium xinjiangense]|uniref:hypothetical protein n=1 Tax=Salinimicrobium xinjiangense TaxID=438596 RepID=UPI0003FD156B|nr:hypothetical protein [Salinimicrobium xinjiangense]